MMKYEFEKLAGYEVSNQDYDNIIEPMYMAINVSKQDFVKMIDKKRFALPTPQKLMKELKADAAHMFDICGRYNDFECEHRMEATAKYYAKRKFGIDWSNDTTAFVYFIHGYEFPELKRGCTYPETLVIGRCGHEYERIQLVK